MKTAIKLNNIETLIESIPSKFIEVVYLEGKFKKIPRKMQIVSDVFNGTIKLRNANTVNPYKLNSIKRVRFLDKGRVYVIK